MNSENLRLMAYWIIQRELLRTSPREVTDKNINGYRYCNVRREDDRGTKALASGWRTTYTDNPKVAAIMALARLLNRPSTYRLIDTVGGPLAPQEWVPLLKNQTGPVFGSAYLVTTCGARGVSKIDWVYRIFQELLSLDLRAGDCEKLYRHIASVYGMGSFLSAQVVADAKFTEFYRGLPDFSSFAKIGPGSSQGLKYLGLGGTDSGFINDLTLVNESLYSLGVWADIGFAPSMQDLQNCLCEFSKFFRITHNLPGRRRPYKPTLTEGV